MSLDVYLEKIRNMKEIKQMQDGEDIKRQRELEHELQVLKSANKFLQPEIDRYVRYQEQAIIALAGTSKESFALEQSYYKGVIDGLIIIKKLIRNKEEERSEIESRRALFQGDISQESFDYKGKSGLTTSIFNNGTSSVERF